MLTDFISKAVEELSETDFEFVMSAKAKNNLQAFLTSKLTSLAEEMAEASRLEERPDIDLAPGFMITAEYRLGEIRGLNQAVSDQQLKINQYLGKN